MKKTSIDLSKLSTPDYYKALLSLPEIFRKTVCFRTGMARASFFRKMKEEREGRNCFSPAEREVINAIREELIK